MSWPKVALMISLPVKSSLLKLPSICERDHKLSLQYFEYHQLSQSIFTKLNEIVYIMDGGQNNGMLATDKKCNWHKLTSSRDRD